ncbi:MAG TPA: BlaI/MecI/CopY family transcriptional regulator [Bryobacteraceae bacterium]|jgi:predicted transcriptional regulator|nr:BlaI/MecI/CopY family transcriptional regulator [Bryobacteraceae bacterium]
MPAPPSEKLTRREREIMDAIFALGNRASAEDVRARLTDPPSYSAVRAMLVKLEAKGFVRHREEGLRYVYEPTRSRAAEQRSALERLTRVFFGGSPRQTVTALLQQERWTKEDLDELRRQIDRAQKGTKS